MTNARLRERPFLDGHELSFLDDQESFCSTVNISNALRLENDYH